MSVPSDLPLVLTTEAVVGRTDPGSCLHAQLDHLLDAGVDWLSLPADLRSAYALGYYIGNVRNGGHSQFIGNAFRLNGVGPMQMLQDAALAAIRYDLPQTLAVIRQATGWVAANPELARMQTGFTGGRAAELDPLDTALYAADLVDEPAWLAELAQLGPEIAANLLDCLGHAKGYVRFPCNPSHLREIRFLLTREPRVVVDETQRKDTVAKSARDVPGAFDAMVLRHLAQLQERLPNAGACAALHLMRAHGQWQGLPDSATLAPVQRSAGAAPNEAVFAVTALERPHVMAILADKTVRLYRTRGEPARTPGLSVNLPPPPKGLVARLLALIDPAQRKKRRAATEFNARAQGTLRRANLVGKTPLQTGEEISAAMGKLGIPPVLAVHLARTGARPVNRWRLLHDKTGDGAGQIWLFGTEDDRLFELGAVAQGVMIRDRATGEETTYPPFARNAPQP